MYKRQRLPGPPATVRSVGTGQAGEVELRRQTPISPKNVQYGINRGN